MFQQIPLFLIKKNTNHPDQPKSTGMISEDEDLTIRKKKRGLSEQIQIALV
ncbi:hypothetical protein [Sphingobacterium ginsenosidimutans]|uniref:hypothetical protein n=1 Tax=Sphingobacterium ginsenosidimutans TaxID=687845 RepID=UPI0031F81022